jgi:hypothetical protein
MEIKLKDLWWEDQNLHYITEDDQHVILENAWLSKMTWNPVEGSSMVVEEVKFVCDRMEPGSSK